MEKRIINIGDVFEIPLSDGRRTFGQFVDQNMGQIVRIFDHFIPQNGKVELEKIDTSKLLFSPIKVGLNDPIRSRMWTIVGKLPIDNYSFPGFLNFIEEIPSEPNPSEGVKIKKWFFEDGKNTIEIGPSLPKEYQKYSDTGVYSADLIVQRIESDFDIMDYPKKHNRFLTKEEIKKMYPKIKDK